MKAKKQHKPVRVSGRFAKCFAEDVKAWGGEVALYNNGWLNGWDDGHDKGYRAGFERAMTLMTGGAKWTNAERRIGNQFVKDKKAVRT